VEWCRLLRDDKACLESFTGYDIRTVQSNHQAEAVIADWDAAGRPETNFKVVFPGEMSETDIKSLRLIFVDHGAQSLILHSSGNSSTLMDAAGSDESELDDEYVWLAELGST
jgi:hypothetical protein